MSDKALSIGIFYGSTTCYTEMAAEKIQAQLNALFDDDLVEMHNIKDVNLSKTHEFDVVLFGISTWDFGELQEDWESHWDDVYRLDLSGKIIALFGLGHGSCPFWESGFAGAAVAHRVFARLLPRLTTEPRDANPAPVSGKQAPR